MSIDVPPAPSQDAAAPVYAQLAALMGTTDAHNAPSKGTRMRKALLIVSLALGTAGAVFHACAFVVTLAPHSDLARLVLLIGKTLFEEVRI